MATAQDALRAAADKLDDAFGAFFRENDYLSAYDYREEGYELAEHVLSLPVDDRADEIDNAVSTFPESARYLIACAAAYRLAELEASVMERAA